MKRSIFADDGKRKKKKLPDHIVVNSHKYPIPSLREIPLSCQVCNADSVEVFFEWLGHKHPVVRFWSFSTNNDTRRLLKSLSTSFIYFAYGIKLDTPEGRSATKVLRDKWAKQTEMIHETTDEICKLIDVIKVMRI